MSQLLAIDPGNVESAVLVYDTEKQRVVRWQKLPNADVLEAILRATFSCDRLAVEMIASYGMAVGKEVFDTCVWIGRFVERWSAEHPSPARLVYRREVKMHLCGNNHAKDKNVRQALIDKFGPGKEVAVGLKASPGPLYGLSGDGWSALGVAVVAAEA